MQPPVKKDKGAGKMEKRQTENTVRELVRILSGFTPEQLDRFQSAALRLVERPLIEDRQDKDTQGSE